MPIFERESFWDDFQTHAPEMFPSPKRRRTIPVRPAVEEATPVSVLFVDSHNQVRSVLAQAQAEVVRLWTLNQRGYNMFSCIDSAGLHVSSSLTRKRNRKLSSPGQPPNRTAIDALLGDYDLPKEKEDIRYRILYHQTSRGITYEDFDRFDYILAFDKESLTDLRDLHWIAHQRARHLGHAGVKARTRLIGDYNPNYSSRQILLPSLNSPFPPTQRDFDSTIRNIEAELYNFLEAKTNWTPPSRVAPAALVNRYRSRQFLARSDRVTDAKIETLKLLYGRVNVDKRIPGRDTRVVTVTGREGPKLREAYDNAKLALG